MTILDMMAMGIPVVTEPKGGIVEQIIHGYNGFISYHLEDLKKYSELLYEDEDLRKLLSEGAKAQAKKFDIKYQWEKYRELINKLMA